MSNILEWNLLTLLQVLKTIKKYWAITNMTLTIRYIKVGLSKFKDKKDLDICIRKFNNICQIKKEIANEDKLALFSITFKNGYLSGIFGIL